MSSDTDVYKVVKDIFKDYVGYAVEAGAFDGIFESTTYDLELDGWKVLLIEPIPEIFERLVNNRNKAFCLPYALGPHQLEKAVFKVFPSNNGASASSLNPDNRILADFYPGEPKEILVNIQTLDFCLEEVEFPRLDVLSLDVEGYEDEVLKGFSFAKWSPKVLIIDDIYQDFKVQKYLEGYKKLLE